MGKLAHSRPIDWEVVRRFFAYELHTSTRSRDWTRLLSWFAGIACSLATAAGVHHLASHRWGQPEPHLWLLAWTEFAATALLCVSFAWTSFRMGRLLRVEALEELLLTTGAPADMVVGAALGCLATATLLFLSILPGAFLACAAAGSDVGVLARVMPTLALCALLGHALGACAHSDGDWARSHLVQLGIALLLIITAGLVGLFAGDWLTAPFNWLMRRNPVTAVTGSTEALDPDWGWSVSVFLLLTLAALRDAHRALRRDWSLERLAHRLDQSRQSRTLKEQVHSTLYSRRLTQLLRYPYLPAIWREHRKRLRRQRRKAMVETLWMVVCSNVYLLNVAGFQQGRNVAGRRFAAALLFVLLLTVGHDAVALVYQSVRGERWPEWLLTRLRSTELARWLLGVMRPWWIVCWTITAAAMVVVALLRPVPAAVHLLWAALAFGIMPVTYSLWTMLLALYAPTRTDAHLRSVMLLAIPGALGLAVPFGVKLDALSVVSPIYALVSWAFTGRTTLPMWAGLVLTAATLPYCWRQLCRCMKA